MFEIKKGVPLPSKAKGGRKYAFADMAVGDSFFAPDDLGSSKNKASKRQSSISGTVRSFCKWKKLDWKFTTRKMPDGTIGCWRVS